jgi:hypothetical protein
VVSQGRRREVVVKVETILIEAKDPAALSPEDSSSRFIVLSSFLAVSRDSRKPRYEYDH